MDNLTKIKKDLKDDDKKILKIAKTAKGKNHLVLAKNKPIKTVYGNTITFYDIIDYENGIYRGSTDETTLSEAKKNFYNEVKAWNKYNTQKGKLRIIK